MPLVGSNSLAITDACAEVLSLFLMSQAEESVSDAPIPSMVW